MEVRHERGEHVEGYNFVEVSFLVRDDGVYE